MDLESRRLLPKVVRRVKTTWEGEQGADSELLNEVKMLPIRIVNSGAARALKHVTD